jgi:hypothetical protein
MYIMHNYFAYFCILFVFSFILLYKRLYKLKFKTLLNLIYYLSNFNKAYIYLVSIA